MKTEKYLGKIACLIEHAEDKFFTLNATQLMDFAKQVIAAITEECGIGKTIMSGAEALAKVKAMFLNGDGSLMEDVEFFSDKDAMENIYETVFTLMTVKWNKYDVAIFVQKIKNDEAFARDFLYGSSLVPGKSIARLRSRIINQVRQSYGVVVDPADFSTILYSHLYSEGTWRVLDSYSRGNFFCWLSVVASHCILAYLEENGFIKISRARTPGNTRLVLKKMTPDYCHNVINDMVKIGPMRDILLAVYEDRLDQDAIKRRFNLDEEMYKLTLRAAEKTLKTALLNTEHPYDDVLVDKGSRKIMQTYDFETIIGQTNPAFDEDSPLRQVLGIAPDDADFECKVNDFLYNFTKNLGWNDEDKFVWQSRFILNMKPLDIVKQLPNRSRPWLDTRYSRLDRQFRKAIREWWTSIHR